MVTSPESVLAVSESTLAGTSAATHLWGAAATGLAIAGGISLGAYFGRLADHNVRAGMGAAAARLLAADGAHLALIDHDAERLRALGEELAPDPVLMAVLEERFGGAGAMPETNRRQGMRISGKPAVLNT